jgi:hypothetical protein
MTALLTRTDHLLRGSWDPAERGNRLLGTLAGLVLFCGAFYGAVMGSFGGITGLRMWQLIYSAAKVPLLLLGTLSICLPSFFVLNTVAGLRSDFRDVLRALLGAQATLTVLLCALAPFTALWYLSFADYHAAVLFNGVIFGVASCATQLSLQRAYQPLVRRNPKHRLLGRAWLILYVFVGMQLGWLLRPFVGEPSFGVEMFRADAWGNVYVEVLHHLERLLAGH